MKYTEEQINKFIKQYNKEYNFIYETEEKGGYVVGYDDAINEMEERLKAKDPAITSLIPEFFKATWDFPTSDRQMAAFMFAFVEVLEDDLYD